MFLVFLTLENFNFSSIRNTINTSQNHCQIHSESPFNNDFRKRFKSKKYFCFGALKVYLVVILENVYSISNV